MIALKRIVAPTELPVSVAELKAHARIVHSSEDAYIASLLVAATTAVEEHTRRALLTQQWRMTTEARGAFALPRPPHATVEEVRTLDMYGETAVVDPSLYWLDADAGELRPLFTWDAWRVVVDYTAGYGAAAADVPADLRHAIKFIAALYYAQREHVVMGTIVAEVPTTLKYLLHPYVVRHSP